MYSEYLIKGKIGGKCGGWEGGRPFLVLEIDEMSLVGCLSFSQKGDMTFNIAITEVLLFFYVLCGYRICYVR